MSSPRAIHHFCDLNVLDRDPGQVGHGDLVLAGSSDRGVLDDLAQLKNGAFLDESLPNCSETLTVMDTL